jgi:hypothetical protein
MNKEPGDTGPIGRRTSIEFWQASEIAPKADETMSGSGNWVLYCTSSTALLISGGRDSTGKLLGLGKYILNFVLWL